MRTYNVTCDIFKEGPATRIMFACAVTDVLPFSTILMSSKVDSDLA